MTHPHTQNAPIRELGFTLLELIISVAIVAILAAVAVPSYSQYVTQSRRADGVAELTRVMQRQEKYFINSLKYTINLEDLGLAATRGVFESEGGYYQIIARACSGSTIARCVILTAFPQGPQEEDGWLSLTSRGQRDWELNAAGETGWP